MRYFTAILITLFLSVPAMSVELFRYRGAAKDGGTLEYIFETAPIELNTGHDLVSDPRVGTLQGRCP